MGLKVVCHPSRENDGRALACAQGIPQDDVIVDKWCPENNLYLMDFDKVVHDFCDLTDPLGWLDV